jgi:RNA recognition motif-containing protein
MNIYVGNLSFDASEDSIRQVFAPFGEVSSVNIITDKYSGKSRGFGFVEMPNQAEALKAIENINGKDLLGRKLNVNEAKARTGGGRSEGRGGGRSEGRGGGGRNRY